MQLCDDGHDEVCYEGRLCPCCELINQCEAFEKTVAEANDIIKTLEGDLREVEKELDRIKTEEK